MATNRKVLLETKCGFKLLNDRFVDNKGVEHLIKDMKSAQVKEGNSVSADSLFITFKDGESKQFFFRSLPTPLWSRMKSAMMLLSRWVRGLQL